MASFVFTEALHKLGTAGITGLTIRALACMTNSTITTAGQEDATTLSALTLDELDGSGYSRQTLTGVVLNKDTSTNTAKLVSNAITFGSAVSAGTRLIKGIVLFTFITNDAASWPIVFLEKSGNPDGGPLTVPLPTAGFWLEFRGATV